MDHNIRIAPFNGNINQVVQLHTTIFPESTRQETKFEFKDYTIDPSGVVATAHYDGKMVGYCVAGGLQRFRHLPPVATTAPGPFEKTLYVRYMGCSEEMRGQGICKEILRTTFDVARQKGYVFVTGHFAEGSAHRAAQRTIPHIDMEMIIDTLDNHGTPYHYVIGKLDWP